MQPQPPDTEAQRPLIIEQPHLQEARKRFAYSLATFAAWIVWVYLWLPLISLLAWYFGFKFLRDHMILAQDSNLQTLIGYAVVILAFGGSLIAWSRYNLARFRGVERRKPVQSVTANQLSNQFRLASHRLALLKKGKRSVLWIDAQGKTLGIKSRSLMSDEDYGTGQVHLKSL